MGQATPPMLPSTLPSTDPLLRAVTNVQYKQEYLVSILDSLAETNGFAVNFEDVDKDHHGALSLVRVDYASKDVTCTGILDALSKQTGVFSWKRDGNVVNIIAVAIKNENPFDKMVEPIRFTGTISDFIDLMNQKDTTLRSSETAAVMGRRDAVIIFETKEPYTLRQVYNRFASQAGVRWYALEIEPATPVASSAPTTATTDSGASMIHSTDTRFIPISH